MIRTPIFYLIVPSCGHEDYLHKECENEEYRNATFTPTISFIFPSPYIKLLG